MTLNRRRLKILELIREDGHAKVHDLSRLFKVTEVTIRQDLETLENMGYVQREHGGAFLSDIGTVVKSGQVFNQMNMEKKKEIAKKAVTFINEGG